MSERIDFFTVNKYWRMRSLVTMLWMAGYLSASAQVVGRLYYNEKWELVNKDFSVYFRVGIIDTTNQIFAGAVRDFTKDGKPVMTGAYQGGQKNGHFTVYYRNGKIESEGTYRNNIRVGIWRYLFPNGVVKSMIDFGQDGYLGSLSLQDSLGNDLLKNGNGNWYFVTEDSPGNSITVKGAIKDSRMEGEWTYEDSDGTIWCTSTFEQGEFLNGFILTDGNVKVSLQHSLIEIVPESHKYFMAEHFIPSPGLKSTDYPYIAALRESHDEVNNRIYSLVELPAHPEGGLVAFYNEVGGLIRYPPDARRRGIEGKVFVEFIISEDGELSDFKVVKGIGSGCDQEAIRVIQQSQERVKWIPGVQRRTRVRQRYTLALIFKLG